MMEKALENSRFSGLSWENILQAYFGEELISQKGRKISEQQEKERYFTAVLEATAEGPGKLWLEKVLQTQGEGNLLLIKNYKENPDYLRKVLEQVLKAILQLPFLMEEQQTASMQTISRQSEKVLLAVFAARTTGDPHFFDTGTLGEQLLIAFLKSVMLDFNIGKRLCAEEKASLFYEAGLLIDDLSNFTLAYGIHAWARDGKVHEGVEGFWNRREPVLLTLMNLGSFGSVGTTGRRNVYIVENPAVFSVLIGEWRDDTIICGNGQIRLATLTLLDLFDDKTTFYYAGDFDPEGLQIAQRLKERYQERLQFWNYHKEYYEKYKSGVEITERSLRKLDKIYLKELQEMKSVLLKEKKAVYQETMLREYLMEKPDDDIDEIG
ncbi:MAG: DUF2399 domain-containing protein [Lachnospiraceae bacterium]|nr:DUF2399 domain-containing protein [Lachnospiraceae bacterium]